MRSSSNLPTSNFPLHLYAIKTGIDFTGISENTVDNDESKVSLI